MDFHKLQHALNEIEPSDRNRDIEMLRRAAQGDNGQTPREEVSESAASVAPTPTPVAGEPMDEAAQMAALAGVNAPRRESNPEMLDEARQMAALAGIPMSEGYKKGKAGQLKGKDKVGKSKPSKSGEQKNVTHGKLVGSTENDDDSIEEGPKWDQMKKDWEAGKKDYNNIGALKGAFGNNKKDKKSSGDNTGKASNKSNPASGKQLSPELAKTLAKYENALTKISNDSELGREFQQLMKKAEKKNIGESTYSRPIANESDKSSIKNDLYRRLNNSK